MRHFASLGLYDVVDDVPSHGPAIAQADCTRVAIPLFQCVLFPIRARAFFKCLSRLTITWRTDSLSMRDAKPRAEKGYFSHCSTNDCVSDGILCVLTPCTMVQKLCGPMLSKSPVRLGLHPTTRLVNHGTHLQGRFRVPDSARSRL